MDDFTIGVEEEYQLVDPETGTLVSRAREVLAADWTGETCPEVQNTMLERGTRVCSSSAELESELDRLRLQAASVAASLDLAPVAAGLHPFSRPSEGHATEDDRYRDLRERFGWVARTDQVFGMHVHVGVPKGVDRIELINRIPTFRSTPLPVADRYLSCPGPEKTSQR